MFVLCVALWLLVGRGGMGDGRGCVFMLLSYLLSYRCVSRSIVIALLGWIKLVVFRSFMASVLSVLLFFFLLGILGRVCSVIVLFRGIFYPKANTLRTLCVWWGGAPSCWNFRKVFTTNIGFWQNGSCHA